MDADATGRRARSQTASFRLDLDYFRHHREDVDVRLGGRRADRRHGSVRDGARRPPRTGAGSRTRRSTSATATSRARRRRVYEEAFFALLRAAARALPARRARRSPAAARMNSVANGKVYAATRRSSAVYIQAAAGRRGRRRRRRSRRLSGARRRARAPDRWSTPTGARRSTDDEMRRGCSTRDAARLEAAAATVARDRATSSALPRGRRARSPTARSWAGSRGAWSGGRARSATARSSCDPRRADMRTPQPQDQAPRVVPPVRAFDPARGDDGVVRGRRRRAVHDEGLSRSARRSAPQIPAVTHVDGTGRLQTVTATTNPRYYDLIRRFARAHRRADGPQHLVQRERADRQPARGGARLLPAHADGRAGAQRHCRRAVPLTRAPDRRERQSPST